jgi:hypothetical protein
VSGLELVAEGSRGRRNRIATVLVRPPRPAGTPETAATETSATETSATRSTGPASRDEIASGGPDVVDPDQPRAIVKAARRSDGFRPDGDRADA